VSVHTTPKRRYQILPNSIITDGVMTLIVIIGLGVHQSHARASQRACMRSASFKILYDTHNLIIPLLFEQMNAVLSNDGHVKTPKYHTLTYVSLANRHKTALPNERFHLNWRFVRQIQTKLALNENFKPNLTSFTRNPAIDVHHTPMCTGKT
jgi:hypothetical protein